MVLDSNYSPRHRRPVLLVTLVLLVVGGLAVTGTWFVASSTTNGIAGRPAPVAAGERTTERTMAPPPSTTRPPDAEEEYVITARDQSSQITVPGSWVEFDDEPADVEEELLPAFNCGDPMREAYLLGQSDAHEDFADFAAFVNVVVQLVQESADAELGEPRRFDIAGLAAVQYQVPVTVEGQHFISWATMVDGRHGYYRIAAWTLPSHLDVVGPVIEEVMMSFRELDTQSSG